MVRQQHHRDLKPKLRPKTISSVIYELQAYRSTKHEVTIEGVEEATARTTRSCAFTTHSLTHSLIFMKEFSKGSAVIVIGNICDQIPTELVKPRDP